MNIRIAKVEDFDKIYYLLKQLWENELLDKGAIQIAFKESIESRSSIFLVAESENTIIGFISLSKYYTLWQRGYIGQICELVIHENYRRRKIGTTLLNRVIEVGKLKGFKRIELNSSFVRKKSHQFYLSNHFENRGYVFSLKL